MPQESYDPNKKVIERVDPTGHPTEDAVNPRGLGKNTLPNQPHARVLASEEELDDNNVKPTAPVAGRASS